MLGKSVFPMLCLLLPVIFAQDAQGDDLPGIPRQRWQIICTPSLKPIVRFTRFTSWNGCRKKERPQRLKRGAETRLLCRFQPNFFRRPTSWGR